MAEIIEDFLLRRRAIVFVDRLIQHGPGIAEKYAKRFYKTNDQVLKFRPYVKKELLTRGVPTDGLA